MKFCPECGTQRVPGGKFCVECGHRLAAPAQRSVREIAQELQGLAARTASGELSAAQAGAERSTLMRELAAASAASASAASASASAAPERVTCPVCSARSAPGGPCDACGLPIHDLALMRRRQHKVRGQQTHLRNLLTADAALALRPDEPLLAIAHAETGWAVYVLTDTRILAFRCPSLFKKEQVLTRTVQFTEVVSYSDLGQHRAGDVLGSMLQGIAESAGHVNWSFGVMSSREGQLWFVFSDDEAQDGAHFHAAFEEVYQAHEAGQPVLTRLLLAAAL